MNPANIAKARERMTFKNTNNKTQIVLNKSENDFLVENLENCSETPE